MVRPASPLEWQPPDGAQVLLHGLVGDNAVFNGSHGHVLRRCNSSQRLIVCVEESRARLRVYPRNLRQPSRPPSLPSCGLRGGAAAAAASLARAVGSLCLVHLEPSTGRQLGFGAEAGADGRSLRLTRIDAEGLLSEWNRENPNLAIQLGDRIVEVNGLGGGTQALAGELRSQSGLDIRVQRGTGSSWLPAIAEKAEARPLEPPLDPALTVTGFERRGSKSHDRPSSQALPLELPSDPAFTLTGFERGGPNSRGRPPHHGCDGLPPPGDSLLQLDKERGASLLHSLKMMVAQLEGTCNDGECWGRKKSR